MDENEKTGLPIVLELDRFANLCGYFRNEAFHGGPHINNGYNCCHPGQEETVEDEDTGRTVGCCYGWSCPLAYAAGPEELLEYGVISEEDAEESIAEGESVYRGDCEYVVVSDAATIDKLRKLGVSGLAEGPNDGTTKEGRPCQA